jgi:ABC-type antimicrobial peptide transport system permease subunit
VYATVAYGITQRSRELGIRSALGAGRSDLLALVATEMVWVTAGGVAAGVAGAWMLSRILEALVYGVHVHDPATFLLVPLVLALAAAAATLIPARRAMRPDPIEVMRAE